MPRNEESAGTEAVVTRGVPPAKVTVLKDQTIVHEGVEYLEGDDLEMDGPLAWQHVAAGHVEYKQ